LFDSFDTKNDRIVATIIAGGIHDSMAAVRTHPLVKVVMKPVAELAKASWVEGGPSLPLKLSSIFHETTQKC
jgi:hypothetical protein